MLTFDAVTSLYDRLTWERDPFPHLSRVLELPPLVAQAAFDAVGFDRARPGPGHVWAVEVPAGRLELAGSGLVSPPPRACYWSYRDVPGLIRAAPWPLAIPIRLELLPWSTTRTALGLGVRRLPLLSSDDAYIQVGVQALQLLSNELNAWGLHELHDLEHWLHAQSGHAD